MVHVSYLPKAGTMLTNVVSISGRDLRSHLIGTQAVILASQDKSDTAISTSIRQTCLFTAFRQELYIALMAQRPVQYAVPYEERRETISDDWTWARRAVTDCASVVNYVFGGDRDPDRGSALDQNIRSWQQDGPLSFRSLDHWDFAEARVNGIPDCPMLAPCHGK